MVEEYGCCDAEMKEQRMEEKRRKNLCFFNDFWSWM